jgi:hypothetical protein
MLSAETMLRVHEDAAEFWSAEVKKPYFGELAQGKEIGHRLADLVDDKTTALLTLKHVTRHQYDARGKRLVRSMGDVWLEDNRIMHAINVKTGVVGVEGQPNMVSLKKLLEALLEAQIDSYYLLFVKMKLDKEIAPSIVFVDLLDYLDFVTFDSGPGQLMLKAKAFFLQDFAPRVPSPLSAKVEGLMALLEDGERRLRLNRERDLKYYRARVEAYLAGKIPPVTPETQKGLCLA